LRRRVMGLGTGLLVCVLLLSDETNAQPATAGGYCKVVPSRADAVDWPSKHAWELFIALNHPAIDENIERGVADCSKPIGTPGTTAVWETWRNASTEVYLADGAEPPDWSDTSLPDAKPGTVPEIHTFELATAADRKRQLSFHDSASRFHPAFSPEDGVFRDVGGFGETRMNRSAYEFIRRQCLYSADGQKRYAKAIEDGKKPPVSFPPDAIEVKAAWLDFEKEKTPTDKQRTYYSAEYEGKKYGLVALHIITKDIPNWFWASFHHVDAPENKFESPDTFGRPTILDGTVWQNYRLGGTQVDFVSPTGSATILSDHYVEFGFQRSSCITCHATAAISSSGRRMPGQPLALCAMNGTVPALDLDLPACKKLIGEYSYFPNSDRLIVERGVPDPHWFETNGKTVFIQTDFVWSIPFRGQPEKAPPPKRCEW